MLRCHTWTLEAQTSTAVHFGKVYHVPISSPICRSIKANPFRILDLYSNQMARTRGQNKAAANSAALPHQETPAGGPSRQSDLTPTPVKTCSEALNDSPLTQSHVRTQPPLTEHETASMISTAPRSSATVTGPVARGKLRIRPVPYPVSFYRRSAPATTSLPISPFDLTSPLSAGPSSNTFSPLTPRNIDTRTVLLKRFEKMVELQRAIKQFDKELTMNKLSPEEVDAKQVELVGLMRLFREYKAMFEKRKTKKKEVEQSMQRLSPRGVTQGSVTC